MPARLATHGRPQAAPVPEEYSLFRRRGPWKDALRRRMLAVADTLTLLLAIAVASFAEGHNLMLWTLGLLPLWLLIAKVEGLYDKDQPKIWYLTIDEGPALLHWVTVCVAVTSLLMAAVLDDGWLSAKGAAVMWLTAFAGAVMFRSAVRNLWRRIVPPERGLVIGSGQLATAVRRKLKLEPGHHMEVVGYTGPQGTANGSNGGSPPGVDTAQLHELDQADLEELIAATQAERVILAAPELDEPTLARVVGSCRSLGVKLSVTPPMRAMLGTATELSHIAELPVIEYRTGEASRSTMALKRASDVVISAVGLLVLAPVMAIVALAIKLDSRGPVLFIQPRAGRNGVPFPILKFRTMVQDAEARISEVMSLEDLSEPMFKMRHDPRVTRLGRFLRQTSLDELPQLINVVRGDMSLVGPRPEALWLVDRYSETERFRLEMRPGITGPMQVHGRGELTFQERLAVEREYVENYSPRKDMKILLRTVSAVARARGAF
ncbi:MAG: sugar transferase [Thermoleophilaceae bacterium]|nr:sugar transferase [Thermoleophilaceae bacterium]